MPYFEMSLENGREYVYQNDSSVVESDLGMWMVVFLDVDWGDQIKKAEALLCGEELPQSGLGFIKGMDYGQRVAAWYRELKSSLSPQHPLLKLLVEQQLRNRLCCAFYPEEPWKLRQEELAYLQVLDGTDAEYEEVSISPVFLRQWLNDVVKIFTQLQMCQSQLAPLLDEVMSREPDNQGSILRAYFTLQRQNLLYRNLVESSYQALSPRFYISRNHKIYRYDGGTDTVPAKEKLEGHTYMATDQLAALTVWEFEMLCANEIPLRRCAYCGRYFRPYSVVNCYCDRVVEGTNGKTCKQVGATSKHQQAVNQDAAKKLYRKVCNRIQTAAQRRKDQYPNIMRRYNKVQLYGKELMEQVEAGDITFVEFQEKFDRSTAELLGIK